MYKNILFTLVCLYSGSLYAANDVKIDLNLLRINVENSPQVYATGKEYANTLICKGVLRGVLLNGRLSDYPTGAFENCSFYKELVRSILFLGDTVTASPRMLSADRCKNGVLDLENMQLVTVRDWHYQEWFNKVFVINLAYNQLNEIPAPFFKLFPRARKYIFTANPITHLDTTYMYNETLIIANSTKLKSISSNSNKLSTGNLEFNISNTPLANDFFTLNILQNYCKPKKSLFMSCIDCCLCKNKDLEHDTSSRINL